MGLVDGYVVDCLLRGGTEQWVVPEPPQEPDDARAHARKEKARGTEAEPSRGRTSKATGHHDAWSPWPWHALAPVVPASQAAAALMRRKEPRMFSDGRRRLAEYVQPPGGHLERKRGPCRAPLIWLARTSAGSWIGSY